jgi:hypothetical protein
MRTYILYTVTGGQYGKKSFSYEAAILWNSLPDQARNLSTFGTFKNFTSTRCFSENCFCSSQSIFGNSTCSIRHK